MVVQAAIKINGIVYTGHRHPDIIRRLAEEDFPKEYIRNGIQGFITDTGEFLDRKEALEEFIKCEQIPASGKLGVELFSEDLY